MLHSKPKLLCDANVPYRLNKLLEEQGFDVIRPSYRAEDEEIAEKAKSEKRIILSFDRDFGNIKLLPPEKYSGIIFIRIRPPLIDSTFSSLINLFNSVKHSEIKGRLFVISLSGFRIYPKLDK